MKKYVSRKFIATIILVVLNTVLYAVMVMCSRDHTLDIQPSKTLIDWGGNFGPLTLRGEPWRLLTCTFIHASLPHVLVNMLGLYFVGREMEVTLGTKKFLYVYFISGIIGALASVEFRPLLVSVGASGAIVGIIGAAFSLVGGVGFDQVLRTMKRRVAVLIVFISMMVAQGYFMPGVDNDAHFGGLVAGLLSGFALISLSSNKFRKTAYSTLISLAILPIIGYFVISMQYQGDLRFDAQMDYIEGEELFDTEKYDEALPHFEKALEQLGSDPDPKYKKERCTILKARTGVYVKMKRYDDAISDIDESEKIVDKDELGPLIATRALVKHRQLKLDEAIDLYSQAAKETPDNASIMNDLAWSQTAAGQLDDALVNVNKALAKEPNSTSMLDTRGTVYLLMKKYPEAIKDLDRAIRLNPKEGAAYFHRAAVDLAKGETEKCDKDVEAAFEVKYDMDGWEPKTFPEIAAKLDARKAKAPSATP